MFSFSVLCCIALCLFLLIFCFYVVKYFVTCVVLWCFLWKHKQARVKANCNESRVVGKNSAPVLLVHIYNQYLNLVCSLLKIISYTYLDDALARGQWQSHQTGPINGHDLVSYVQSARPLSRPSMHHVGNDDSGQDGAPPTLHNDHTHNLPFSFLYEHLGSAGRPQANRNKTKPFY